MADARVLASGQLEFQPQPHTICGLCRESFLICSCHGLRPGSDYVMVGLPAPAPNSTRSQFLQRWCSLVSMSRSMGVFAANQWFQENGQPLLTSMQERSQLLHEMIDDYVAQLAQDTTLLTLAEIIGGATMTQQPQAAQIQVVGAEALAALAIFLSGDWACLTYIGSMLLQNAFQVSDPQKYSLDDAHLQTIFECGIDVLKTVLEMGYDKYGWCLALEMNRTPVGTTVAPADARFTNL